MLKNKNFSVEVFASYLNKLRTESDSIKYIETEQALTSWLNWLYEKRKISLEEYNNLNSQIKNNKRINSDVKKEVNIGKSAKLHFFHYYIALGVILFLASFGFNFYLWHLVSDIKTNIPVAQSKGRVLPFKGSIKQTDGSPLDTKRDAIFNLYTTLEGGTPIYTGSCLGESGLEPTYNGTFSILVGSDCGMKPIPEEFFQNNTALYLGITIGNELEFSPRYQIITSTFSQDTNKLQGLSTGTGLSSIPYINEEGQIEISNESPTLKSTNGLFTIEGNAITFRSTTEGSNIIFDPAVGADVIIGSGKLGVGTFSPETILDVSGSSMLGNIVSISNSSQTDSPESSVLKLSLGTSPDGSNAEFIQFMAGQNETNPGVQVGGIRLNNQSVVYETTGADFAEYFEVENKNEFEVSQIVSLGKDGIHPAIEGETIIGVISNTAGFIGNNIYMYNKSVLVGLVGQLDVLATNINGEIERGDMIGSTQIAGYGGKVTNENFRVGYALKNQSKDFANTQCPISIKNLRTLSGEYIKCGKVRIVIVLD